MEETHSQPANQTGRQTDRQTNGWEGKRCEQSPQSTVARARTNKQANKQTERFTGSSPSLVFSVAFFPIGGGPFFPMGGGPFFPLEELRWITVAGLSIPNQ